MLPQDREQSTAESILAALFLLQTAEDSAAYLDWNENETNSQIITFFADKTN